MPIPSQSWLFTRWLELCVLVVLCLVSLQSAAQSADPPTGFSLVIYYPEPPEVDVLAELPRNPLIAKGAIHLVDALPEQPTRPLLHVSWLDDVPMQLPPPAGEALRGLDAGQIAALGKSRQALILEFGHPGSNAMIALALADTLVDSLLEDYGGLPFDLEMRRVISPQRWRVGRIQQATREGPNVMDYTTVIAHSHSTGIRAATVGMVKFGLPDLVIERIESTEIAQMTWIINALAQRMIEGQRPDPEGWFDLDLKQIRQATVRKAVLDLVQPESNARGRFRLSETGRRDSDAFNNLVAIGFAAFEGVDTAAQQSKAVQALFGTKDKNP